MRTRRRTYTAAIPPSSLPEALTVKPIVPVSGTKRRKLQSCTAKAKGSKKKKCITGLWDLHIPSELLREILSRLGLKANIKASTVCKTWCEAAVSVRKLQERRPWLIDRRSPTSSRYILVDLLMPQSKKYKLDFPELKLKDYVISYSRDGWVLMRRSFQNSYALFVNPFSKEHLYLPKGSKYYGGNCLAFSAPPTSTSCVVISCRQLSLFNGDVFIDTWRPGEAVWTTHRFENLVLHYRLWEKCVFSNGVFYCLSTCGCLGVFDPCEETWNLLPVKPCPVRVNSTVFMTEHEGDIFVMYSFHNSKPMVFKLNLEQNVWKKKRDLGGLTVFASCSASFIRAGLSVEERNRIYPSFTDVYGIYYYSLGRGKSSYPPPGPNLFSCNAAWVDPPQNNVSLL